jgi:site-specific DNA-methyltransferase (adenine-specific)
VTAPTRYYDDGTVTIYRGDSLHVLRTLPDESVDAVITDPPYSSGGLHRSDRNQNTGTKYVQTGVQVDRPDFQGDNRDQRSYLAWCSLWLSECLRIIKPGRAALVFTDWRQLPTTTDALQAGGFVWRGVIPWDKGRGTRPMIGFNAQAEYLVWGTRGPTDLGHEVYLDGVQRAPVRQEEKHHQTGKPVGLLEQLLRVVPPGGVVLDPFLGSGTTAVAAQRCGRHCIGIEVTEAYAGVAVARLAQKSLLEAA